MRVLLVAIVVWPLIAEADEFFDLEKDAVGVVNNHLQLRLPKAMVIDAKGESALLDYGTARFTMRMFPVQLDDNVALCVAAARDVKARGAARADTARLAVNAPLAGCAMTPPPPRHEDELLFAAYVSSADGADLLAFYIDDGGFNNRATWLTLARRIAASATPPRHQLGELTMLGGRVAKAKTGWLVSFRTGWCILVDHVVNHTDAKKIGQRGAWELSTDPEDAFATTTIEGLHADCHAETERALARIRGVVETLHRSR